MRPLVLLLAILVTVLAGHQEAAAGDIHDLPTVVAETPPDRLIALFSELAKGIGNADATCDQIADALRAWTDSHQQELVMLKTSVATHLNGIKAAEVIEFDRRLSEHMDVVMAGAILCGEHKGTLEALDALESALASNDAP